MCSIDINDAVSKDSPETALQRLRREHPELYHTTSTNERASFRTGNSQVDCLFPRGELPPGLLVELTGTTSSGKTALLFHVLAGLQQSHRLAYVDCSTTFFPVAAGAAGVKVEQIMVVATSSSGEAVRTVENLFRLTPARVIACDVTSRNDKLKMEDVHRLRISVVRHQGLVVFLTDIHNQLFPPSLISLQLTVTRRTRKTVHVSITKSKIAPAGQSAEVKLI